MTCRKIDRKIEKGTNTIRFFARNNIPVGRTVTYSHIIVNVRPHKEDSIIAKLTVGVNRIEYTGKLTTKMPDLTAFKIHINSIISTRIARYFGWDIRNY